MNILAIDIGSYSVKFLEARVERKSVSVLDIHTVILDQVRKEFGQEIDDTRLQHEIIKDYLKNTEYEGKVIFQIPPHMSTSRYLDLPVVNKKKAELMIPFQLDENLPYPVAQTHHVSTFQKKSGQLRALIHITKRDEFEDYYHYLQGLHLLPGQLTTELSVIQSFVEQEDLGQHFAILDLGHFYTKAYFVNHHHVVSNHLSHVAGAAVNEAIAQTYQINDDEAVLYKHENCFFLTEGQYEEVEEDQREFALLMKRLFTPLINEFRRWELGYRVKYGHPIDVIYLMGGSSNISNIKNFLSQSLNVEVEILNAPSSLRQDEYTIESSEAPSLALASMMATSSRSPLPAINLLIGDYTSSFTQSIPLHSSAFLFTRVLALSLVLFVSLAIERYALLDPQTKNIDIKVTNLLKADQLNISRKDQRLYRVDPDRILEVIKQKDSLIEQEVSTIMSATQVNSLQHLTNLSQILSNNQNINLQQFKAASDKAVAVFRSESESELALMDEHLKKSGLSGLNTHLDKVKKTLTVNIEK